MSGENLDRLCAEYGHRIAKELSEPNGKSSKKKAKDAENLITKSLGVLQQDGVYAFFLYQDSRGNEKLKKCAAEMLGHKPLSLKPFDRISDPLEAIRGNPQKKIESLADNLDDLLLAKALLQQALIYARYHAKALSNVSPESQGKAQGT